MSAGRAETMAMVTVERLRELLDYNRSSGLFHWRVARNNATPAGSRAGYPCWGYIRICIDGHQHSAHRLAWLYAYGEWPRAEIDHIDGDRANNAISNLRVATTQQNQFNKGPLRNNKSGFKGVSWHTRDRKWRAQIRTPHRRIYLGNFDSAEAASAAYAAAAARFHGEFAKAD